MVYIALIILLIAMELLYFKIAIKCNIIDKPNHRSSHTDHTIRGGGIIFPLAMMMAFLMGKASLSFTVAIVIVGLVSFIDDIRPLPTLPRFSVHLIATLLVLAELGLFQEPLWLLPVILIGLVGWINAFNFMDGINGITVLYALVSIVSFGYVFRDEAVFEVLLIMGLACLVFGFFNIRKKAKTFAGDVGSVALAVFLGYMMLKAVFQRDTIAYLLFFSVYGIDALFTILYRLKNKENILQPHRSHLYQFLANEMKWPHLSVSFLYAITQLGVNIGTIYWIEAYDLSWPGTMLILAFMAMMYLLIRMKIKNKIMQLQDK